MTLKTGATLQNGRYVIQTILNQDDLGTTYRAVHTPLDQPVVLQTIHAPKVDACHEKGVPGDRTQVQDATQLPPTASGDKRQQTFIEEVRRRFKAQLPAMTPIVDCFMEGDAAFVVLSLPEGTPPPDLSDWFPQPAPSIKSVNPPANSPEPTPRNIASSLPPTSSPSPLEGTTVVAMPLNVKTYQKDQPYLQGRSRGRRWLPIGLLATALFAGIGGASVGWAVRTDRIAQPGQAPLLEPLLNNEQSFPSLEGWPVNDPIYSRSPSRSDRSSELIPYGSRRDNQPTGQDYFPEPLPEWDSPPPVRQREAARPEYTDPMPDLSVPDPVPPVEVPTADPPTAEVPAAPINPPEKFKPQTPEVMAPAEPPAIAPPAPAAPPAPDPVIPPPVTQ